MKSSVLLALLLSLLLCEVNTRPVLEDDSNTPSHGKAGDEDLEDGPRLMYEEKADPNTIYPEVKDDSIDLNWPQPVQYRRWVSGQKSREPVTATSTARNSGRSPSEENRALDRVIVNRDVPEPVPKRGPVPFLLVRRSSEPESSSKMEGREGLPINVDEGALYDYRNMVQEDQFPLSSNTDFDPRNSASADMLLTPSAAYKPAQFPSASTIRGPVINL